MSFAIDKFAEYIENSLKEGNIPSWVKPWNSIDSDYRNYESGRKYTGFHNILVLTLASMNNNWTDPRFLTYNQARNLGGNVIAGSKGIPVFFWQFIKKNDEGKEKSIPIAKGYTVFNIAQIEGIEIKPLPVITTNNIIPSEITKKMIDSCGIKVNYGGNSAHYNKLNKEITLPVIENFHNAEGYHATICHEFIHGIKFRMDNNESEYSYAEEELIAEIGSFLLCKELKINGYMNDEHLGYIASWKKRIKEQGGKWLYSLCKKANERVKFIMEKMDMEGTENDVAEAA